LFTRLTFLLQILLFSVHLPLQLSNFLVQKFYLLIPLCYLLLLFNNLPFLRLTLQSILHAQFYNHFLYTTVLRLPFSLCLFQHGTDTFLLFLKCFKCLVQISTSASRLSICSTIKPCWCSLSSTNARLSLVSCWALLSCSSRYAIVSACCAIFLPQSASSS